MEVIDIKKRYNELSFELKKELSKMQRSDKVFTIRDEIKALQNLCPHDMGSYDFSQADECPYCGKKFKG
jgi:nitrite reductase/ring-hydroxylating ferredoxin subunit